MPIVLLHFVTNTLNRGTQVIARVKKTISSLALGLLAIGTASADPVENVIGLNVTSPGAFVTSMDRLFESGAMDGYELSLWANSFDGTNPATHTIVARFEDYEAHDRLTAQRMEHPAWAQFGLAVRDLSTVKSTAMIVERLADGSMEPDHRAAVAFSVSVSDPAAYAAALSRMLDATDSPGSTRLVEIRFGGEGATHAVVSSAPSLAILNEWTDELFASDEYRRFTADVASIREVRTVSNYRLIKRWGG